MGIKSTVITFDSETTIWPNKKVFIATCLGNDNSQYTAHISPAEKDLIIFLNNIKHKLTQTELEKLKDLIEEYGSEKYSEGSDNVLLED